MFTLVIALSCLILVNCQTTQHPHGHHSHPTHHTHPPSQTTDPPVAAHTFVDKNGVFMQDVPNKVLVLKTDSGCYVTHLTPVQVNHLGQLELLLKLESEIVHHVSNAHHFHLAHDPDHYSSAIQSACPQLYAYHKEH